MKMKLLAGAAMTAVFAASGALAQDRGVYVGVDAGYHWPEGLEADASNPTYDWTFSSEEDFAGFAKLGYRISPNWRVELEGGYRPGDIESVRGTGVVPGLCRPGVIRTAAAPTCGAPNGELESFTLMANVIYDLFGTEARFRPFIGAGVGVNRVSVDVLGQFATVPGAITPTNPAFQNLSIDDEDVSFAYQGLAGLAFQASERLALDVTYRYLRGSDTDFASTGSAALQPGTFSGEYTDQSVTVGLRYQFGQVEAPPPPPPVEQPLPPVAPPPPVTPPPAPPPPVMQEFVVYFPFDQYVLTPEAQSVIQQAVAYAQQGGASQVVVVGHADTSGSQAYNVRLSERRAKAVADAMVGLGVQQTALQVDWRGETQPAVPTPDGTKEPLNRRTTISVNPGMMMQDPAMAPAAAPMSDPAMAPPPAQ